jgi:hypothetical protein
MKYLNSMIVTLSSPRVIWLITLLALLALALAAGAPDGSGCGSTGC